MNIFKWFWACRTQPVLVWKSAWRGHLFVRNHLQGSIMYEKKKFMKEGPCLPHMDDKKLFQKYQPILLEDDVKVPGHFKDYIKVVDFVFVQWVNINIFPFLAYLNALKSRSKTFLFLENEKEDCNVPFTKPSTSEDCLKMVNYDLIPVVDHEDALHKKRISFLQNSGNVPLVLKGRTMWIGSHLSFRKPQGHMNQITNGLRAQQLFKAFDIVSFKQNVKPLKPCRLHLDLSVP